MEPAQHPSDRGDLGPGPSAAVNQGVGRAELREVWALLLPEERLEAFATLARPDAEDLYLSLSAREQYELIESFAQPERRSWIRLLAPDDAADLIQQADLGAREPLIALLDERTTKEVRALLAYAEDEAGGLMNPRYARLRPEMTIIEAVGYLRKQAAANVETIYYAYVLDPDQRLLGTVSFRDLFRGEGDKPVSSVMSAPVITVREEQAQREVSRILAQHNLLAVPVVDAQGRMKGIITADDVVDVIQEAATSDMHKLGGAAVLDAPYLEVGIALMIRKRAGWLAALFLGEMLTATAMAHFQDEIARAVVLALFVPLIISSGGNAGSQATTLVIRALALGEIRLRDWWRICRREFLTGLALGSTLAAIGVVRILLWQSLAHTYGDHALLLAATVGISLVGVVLWGSLSGSMLPLLLRKLGFDPAAASAPFVATMVDVTGLVIYFSVASVILRGALL